MTNFHNRNHEKCSQINKIQLIWNQAKSFSHLKFWKFVLLSLEVKESNFVRPRRDLRKSKTKWFDGIFKFFSENRLCLFFSQQNLDWHNFSKITSPAILLNSIFSTTFLNESSFTFHPKSNLAHASILLTAIFRAASLKLLPDTISFPFKCVPKTTQKLQINFHVSWLQTDNKRKQLLIAFHSIFCWQKNHLDLIQEKSSINFKQFASDQRNK